MVRQEVTVESTPWSGQVTEVRAANPDSKKNKEREKERPRPPTKELATSFKYTLKQYGVDANRKTACRLMETRNPEDSQSFH